MNLAIVQPMADARAASRPYRDEVAVLAAALRQEGHGVSLVRVGPAEETDLAAAMAESRPDLVLMYVEGLAADAAVRAAGVVASVRGTPLIAFGPHARLCPNPCLSLPGAEAVAVGPADFTVPAYLERRGRTVDSLRAPGLWVQCETGTMRNPLPAPPASLVAQPMPARDRKVKWSICTSRDLQRRCQFPAVEMGSVSAVVAALAQTLPDPTDDWRPAKRRPRKTS